MKQIKISNAREFHNELERSRNAYYVVEVSPETSSWIVDDMDDILSDNRLCQHINELHFLGQNIEDISYSFQCKLPKLSALSLGGGGLDDDSIARMGAFLPEHYLDYIDVRNNQLTLNSTSACILHKTKSLSLEKRPVNTTSLHRFMQGYESGSITALDASCSLVNTDFFCRAISNSYPQLTSLDLSGIQLDMAPYLNSLFDSRLKQLKLSHCDLEDVAIQILGRNVFINLDDLGMSYNKKLSDASLEIVGESFQGSCLDLSDNSFSVAGMVAFLQNSSRNLLDRLFLDSSGMNNYFTPNKDIDRSSTKCRVRSLSIGFTPLGTSMLSILDRIATSEVEELVLAQTEIDLDILSSMVEEHEFPNLERLDICLNGLDETRAKQLIRKGLSRDDIDIIVDWKPANYQRSWFSRPKWLNTGLV